MIYLQCFLEHRLSPCLVLLGVIEHVTVVRQHLLFMSGERSKQDEGERDKVESRNVVVEVGK